MMKFGKRGSTFATVVAAAVVLSVTATGGAVAAGLITSKQIKNNTIKSKDVRDNNLQGIDIRNGSLTGVDLGTGVLAGAVTSALPSGKTIRGTIGGRENNLTASQEVGVTASLPVPARVALDDAHVAVNGSDEPAGACPGSATNPTAAPGYVCIYPWYSTNATALNGYVWGNEALADARYGFQMGFDSVAAGPAAAAVFANWAYTAP